MAKVTEIRDLLQANVRASEGAGTTTLTNADARRQIFNLSAARTVQLPTTDVQAGDVWIMENQASGNFALTVQSSGANTLGLVNSLQASLRCTALQDAPTTAAHWKAELIYSERIYSHGTTYNGGNAPTITLTSGGGTLSSITASQFIPYQLQDGSWRLKVSFEAILSSTSRSTATLAVNGITTASFRQATAALLDGGLSFTYSRVESASNIFQISHSTATTSGYTFSSDIALASKPTWAY